MDGGIKLCNFQAPKSVMPNLTKYVKNDNITYVVDKYWVKKKVA